MLATPFDFVDDTDHVYPAAPMGRVQRVQLVWQKVVGEYRNLGPFRPVLWAHTEVQAEMLGPHALRWRASRLIWTALAAASLLWLMAELRFRPAAAVAATAIAMWNPLRGETWRSVMIPEGFAMPYALLGLICAVRAARSPRPWRWDVAGACCVLAAIGCKNVFAALVPAQVLLRIAPDGRDLREGWRRNGRHASLLALTLVVPIAHLLMFQSNWHAGQFAIVRPSRQQMDRMLGAIGQAVGVPLVPGLALAALSLFVSAGHSADPAPPHNRDPRLLLQLRNTLAPLWQEHRAACVAGAALLVSGIGIYMPFQGAAGRYSMPAVWGSDLWIGALLSVVIGTTALAWKRAALIVVACGLATLAVLNLGKQDSLSARTAMLWDTVTFVERHALSGSCIAWREGGDIGDGNGVHLLRHLHGRGRDDVRVRFVGGWNFRGAAPPALSCDQPTWMISGSARPPEDGRWLPVREFAGIDWGGTRRYACYLWRNEGARP